MLEVWSELSALRAGQNAAAQGTNRAGVVWCWGY